MNHRSRKTPTFNIVRIRQDLGPLEIGLTAAILAFISCIATIWAIVRGHAGPAVVLALDTIALGYASMKLHGMIPDKQVRR